MMRLDLTLIQDWVRPATRVLDLGCGDGTLLAALQRHRQVNGLGLEIDPDKITECVRAGIRVIEQDLDAGLANLRDKSFDTVVMTQALQAMQYPDRVLDEMLRVGRECIITFPNFGHWRCRLYLWWRGRMPVSETLPYQWYNTPNIHLCTVRDFEAMCRERGLRILHRAMVNDHNRQGLLARLWPNLFAATALYHISR